MVGRKDGWLEGRMDGWNEGKVVGWREGRKDGWRDGRTFSRTFTSQLLVEDMFISTGVTVSSRSVRPHVVRRGSASSQDEENPKSKTVGTLSKT